jgi:hypothetical protein
VGINMWVNLKMENQMEMAHYSIRMVINILVNLKMKKLMEMVLFIQQIEKKIETFDYYISIFIQ